MVSLETIERDIRELEVKGKTTYSLCERLAWLYICRDHLQATQDDGGTTQELHGSEFLEACGGVSFPALMKVLDEHMGAIKVVYPQEYTRVLNAIKSLG